PFILRGVSLLGIDSGMAPKALRLEAWARLAKDLDRARLSAMTSTVSLNGVMDAARCIVEGQVRGRVVVEIG
ncbi:MAG: oxidoreductase, partial [Alphaproteobacteria bacterium]